MRFARTAAHRRPASICAAVVALVVGVTAGGSSAQAAPQTASGTDVYIVQVAGAPIASYTGDEPGFAATKPATGEKVDTGSAAAKAYRAHLKDARSEVLRRASLGSRAAVYNYDVVLNGFAMRLTAVEATRLQHTSGVLHVWPSETFTTDTISTPAFLGLDGTGGVWDKQFGSPAHAGEGVIVGVLDTGFWPESPSFAPLPEPRPDARVIAKKWHGTCDHGSDPNPANRVTCNNKVIGARWYDAGGLSSSVSDEFLSPRDRNSHGSHTASTAAGDHGANAVINGVSIGSASGMAPAARLAIYKIGWQRPDGTAGGSTPDIAAAINDAASDGVDVINLSFSGSQSLIVDPVELAFMFAADAGVFSAASAGNSGPAASTVAHNSPWLTTVAASTHDRSFTRTATLGNGATFSGPGVGTAVASSPLVAATDVALPGVSATAARLCFSDADPATAGIQPALDPVKVAGKIVACDRGTNARTDKSLAVRTAGGVGMILMNTAPNSLNADFHFVPTIHVNEVDRAAILAYITSAGAGATASLSAATQVKVEAPAMAAFSSNGPALAGGGDLLKPDITAPGVDVIAAVSPAGDNGNGYDALSGTSMSSPHIAGIAALVIGKHPGWSPMAVKSALMTTASQTDNAGKPIVGPDGVSNATPLNFGSGHVAPASAFDPGLVYDSGSDRLGPVRLRSGPDAAGVPGVGVQPARVHQREQPELPNARRRVARGNADPDPYGHERGRTRRDLRRPGAGPARHHRDGQSETPCDPAAPVRVVHREDHPNHRRAGCVHIRIPDLGGKQGRRSPHGRWQEPRRRLAQPCRTKQHRGSAGFRRGPAGDLAVGYEWLVGGIAHSGLHRHAGHHLARVGRRCGHARRSDRNEQ